jgi:hypothetical protein
MKLIIYLAAINFLFLIPCAGQSSSASCSAVKFIQPSGAAQAGEAISFSVSLKDESKNLKLEYEWSVSAGEIIEGQGTNSIRVSTNGDFEGDEIIAAVKIRGLDAGCKDVFFGKANVELGCMLPPQLMEYEITTVGEERAIIDLLMSELTNKPDSVAVFYLNFKAPTDDKVNRRTARILNHFTYRKFPLKGNLIFVVVKSDRDSNAIYLANGKKLDIPLEDENIIKIVKSSSLNLKTPAKRK